MPKQLKFDEEARSALLRGVTVMAAAVKATVEVLEESVYKQFLAGYGLGAYLMWKHYPAGADAFGPQIYAICRIHIINKGIGRKMATIYLLIRCPIFTKFNFELRISKFCYPMDTFLLNCMLTTGLLVTECYKQKMDIFARP